MKQWRGGEQDTSGSGRKLECQQGNIIFELGSGSESIHRINQAVALLLNAAISLCLKAALDTCVPELLTEVIFVFKHPIRKQKQTIAGMEAGMLLFKGNQTAEADQSTFSVKGIKISILSQNKRRGMGAIGIADRPGMGIYE